MGLNFSHGTAQWSYSGFDRFRRKLAAAVGVDWDQFCEHPYCGDDPIFALLDHSDCHDDLSVAECRVVAPRLRELVTGWDDEDWDRTEALLLADGMDQAAAAGEPLEFC